MIDLHELTASVTKALPEIPQFREGTVTSTDPLRVRLAGDSLPMGAAPRTLSPLAEGDRVMVSVYHRKVTVLGVLGGASTHKPIRIPEGADLNDYLETGVYLQGWNDNIPAGGGNYPDGRAGILEVFDNTTSDFTLGTYSHVAQRFTTYVGDVWQRHHYSGWKPWRPVNVDSGWINATMQNGWVTYSSEYSPGRYRKLNGVVHLDGLIKDGSLGTATPAFTLPEGFRPSYRRIYPTIANSAIGRIDVAPWGGVIMHTGSSSWMSLAHISFPAEN